MGVSLRMVWIETETTDKYIPHTHTVIECRVNLYKFENGKNIKLSN